jgi:colicin import membrane protein
MESYRDKARAYFLALLVHLGVAASLLVSLLWTQAARPISLPGPVIEAELVGISAAPKAHAVAKPKPAPPKPVEQPPEPAKPPEPKPEPPAPPQRNDQIEREKIAEIATQKAEQAQKAEEERHRQEQVLLEQQKQERERQKQLEDIKRQRADAEKKLKLEKEKLAQLQDMQKNAKPVRAPAQAVPEAEQAKTGSNGQDDSLQAQYFAAIQNAVTTNWLRPDNTQGGVRCMLRIVQIPGGDVIGVEIANPCNADPQTRNSIEQAVKRAAPLPYKGFEKEFQRQINFNFTYDG